MHAATFASHGKASELSKLRITCCEGFRRVEFSFEAFSGCGNVAASFVAAIKS